MRTARVGALAAGVAVAILVVILAQWLAVSRRDIGRSDFTSTYVGASLVRAGHGDALYDDRLQTPIHDRLIAPDHEGNLPFISPPTTAVLALPLSALSLATAYRIFSALQFLLLAVAVVVAARAAPWPSIMGRATRVGVALLALAGTGTLNLLLLGQWDGLIALGLALGYADMRRGREARAGFWLALGLCIAKPHLGLGLAAFLLARRRPRALAGATTAVGAVVAVSLVAVGLRGGVGFAGAVGSAGRWAPGDMLGFTGLFSSWLGDTAAAQALAGVASLLAIGGSAVLGDATRGSASSGRLEAGLAGAIALSLVASPHLFGHDLALLAPALVWCVAAAARRDAAAHPPTALASGVIGLWVVLALAARLDISGASTAPPGRLVPVVLVAGAVATLAGCRRMPSRRRALLSPR